MLGNIYDVVRGALDTVNKKKSESDGSSADVEPTPTKVELENEFMKRYKDTTGQDIYPQYRQVGLGNGQVGRALAYSVNGKNYIPLIHGVDYPFQDRSLLSQIPSMVDVNHGRFTSGSEAAGNTESAPATPNFDILSLLASQGANGSAMGSASTVELPTMEGVQDDNSNMGPIVDPSLPGSIVDPKTALANSVMSGQALPRDEKGDIDYEKLILDFLNKDNGSNAIRDKALADYTASAGNARPIVKQNVGGPGLLALLGTALLAGRAGGDVIRGGAQGIMNATGTRQAEADAVYQAQQAQSQAALKAALAHADSLDASDKQKLATLMGMNKTEADKFYKEQRLLLDQQKITNAKDDIQRKINADGWRAINGAKSPEARVQAAIEHGITDKAQLDVIGKMTPFESRAMEAAGLEKQRAETMANLEPYRQFEMQARTNKLWSDANLNDLKSIGQGTWNAIKDKELKGWDEKRKADLALKSEQVQKLQQDIYSSRAKVQQMASNGLSINQQMTEKNKVDTAVTKAKSGVDEFTSLVGSLEKESTDIKSQIDTLNKQISSGKYPAGMGQKSTMDNLNAYTGKQIKVEDALAKAKASLAGHKSAYESFVDQQKKLGDFIDQHNKNTAGKPKATQKDLDWVRAHPTPGNVSDFMKQFGFDPTNSVAKV